ncbi:transcriptional regulator [Virgibacillus halodenitrificans]|uniref:Transcriptional regulator n=1 Tax=Virgibacillus halodenitrificans TaxID=1482 RepID=A0AAC9J137_VIRHA|nr:helix-turn-helix transcriptional regulator [Virgibacillus halodenitrificans]APC48945.1 transcriptional regulator [Virgibacillus halodenitrificans]
MENKINEYLEIRGFKKKWVADQLGVSQVVLSRWINGHSNPSLENAFRLAELLGCKVDDLYERK